MNALIRKNCLLWEKTALATAYYLNVGLAGVVMLWWHTTRPVVPDHILLEGIAE